MNRRKFITSVAAIPVVAAVSSSANTRGVQVLPNVMPTPKLTGFTSAELSSSIDDFSRMYIEPAMKVLMET